MFTVAIYIDKYELMHNNDVVAKEKTSVDMIKDYLESWLHKNDINNPSQENVNYKEILGNIVLLPEDIQYEMMKHMVNFTSLISLKKYCNKEAFINIGKLHGGMEIWLSSLWDKVHIMASYGEEQEIINSYTVDMTSYNIWRKRVGYISFGIAGSIVILSVILSAFGFYEIYKYTNIILPIVKNYAYYGIQQLHNTHPIISMITSVICWPYYNYWKVLLFSIMIEFTRFNQSKNNKVIY